MRVLEAIRRANMPGPPEDSVRLRVACTGTVLVAIAACASVGEVTPSAAVMAMVLVCLGMVVSHRTRTRPSGWVKVVVAVGAVAAFAWFLRSLTSVAEISSIDGPLSLLLVLILAAHSFHVPARRDLLFSLGASAGLMAVAGAQAIDVQFGLFVTAWVGCGLWGLTELWISSSGGGRISAAGLACALVALCAVAAAAFLVLPAPVISSRASFASAAGAGGAIGFPGALAGDSGTPAQLSHAGTPAARIRVGGYLGFAGSLDTALRGDLASTLVMQVRAQRPSYWVGETFDTWRGESWTESQPPSRPITGGSPFVVPVAAGEVGLGQTDLQTFYLAGSTADIVFHAESADELWFPASRVFDSTDGTVVSPIGLGSGSIYTVESQVTVPTARQLADDQSAQTLPPILLERFEQLPHPYPRAQALARAVTARDTTTYAKVQSLIGWIGRHTHYSLAIPPLPVGADTVDEFLFGNRVGFCEQISTSLAVMLRSLGIPAREAVGYIPGGYNPITDLWQVHVNDAHAWVQVWFPGYGWQDFDPTAVVPTANPSPGATALKSVAAALRRVPWVLVAAAVAGGAALVAAVRRRRARPPTWAAHVARRAEQAGRRAGRPRRPGETLTEYADALDELSEGGQATWRRLAGAVEASAYGAIEPSVGEQRAMVAEARRARPPRRSAPRVPARAGP